MLGLLGHSLLLLFGFYRLLFFDYRCCGFVNCCISLLLSLALLKILSEVSEYPLHLSIMYLKHLECQVLQRDTLKYISLILGVLTSIRLTEEHFELKFLFSLFHSFFGEKFGLLNESIQFRNFPNETISRALYSLLDELLWRFQLAHIGINQPINLIFCKVGVVHRVSWKGKVLFLHSLALHLSQIYFSKHLSFILSLLIHYCSNMKVRRQSS